VEEFNKFLTKLLPKEITYFKKKKIENQARTHSAGGLQLIIGYRQVLSSNEFLRLRDVKGPHQQPLPMVKGLKQIVERSSSAEKKHENKKNVCKLQEAMGWSQKIEGR
jgi:hypothetical protein